MKLSHLFAPICLAFVLTSCSLAQTSAPLTVDQAVDEALTANPEIRASVRRLTLAELKTTTAKSLDDPMLMVRDWSTPLRKPWDLNQAQLMVSLQQTFPGRQKLDLRNRIAEDDVETASFDLEALRNDVAARVRESCASLLRNADEMRLHKQQSSVLQQALSATLAEYTNGKVPQGDVLRAQLALTRLKEHLIELEQERDSARAQLAALLGRSLDESVEIAGSYQASDTTPPIEELERIAIEHRPELAALRREVIKQQDTSELTRMASRPDLTLAGGYMLMPSGSMYRKAYMAELSMNLPALNRFRHEQEAKQSDAATDVMQAELEARTTAVFLEIKQAQIQLRSAQSRAKLYHDTLLPQAQATFQASSEAYENNRAEFTSLIESQNLLLEIRTAYFQSLAAADAATAELEHAIGAPVPGKTSAINQESHP